MDLQAVSHLLRQDNFQSYKPKFITTFSSLDKILGGGIPCGFITQIAGAVHYAYIFKIVQYPKWMIPVLDIEQLNAFLNL